MERCDEALSNQREALDGRRRLLGDDHPQTIESMAQMGALYHARGDWAESEALLPEAANGMDGLPTGHQLRTRLPADLIALYEAWDVAEPTAHRHASSCSPRRT